MARPKKQTVDYFPHYTRGGRTIYILESRYGNDGYAFWFKLLELLAESDGHLYDCRPKANWQFLLAKTGITEKAAEEIIGTLVDLGKVDQELWGQRIIWVQNLVDHFSEIYRKRAENLPQKPRFRDGNLITDRVTDAGNPTVTPVSAAETPQRKVKESKQKEIKENYTKENGMPSWKEVTDMWNAACPSLPRVIKMSDARKVKVRARLAEFGGPEKWRETAQELFRRIEESDFLRGSNRSGWQATFDWVFANGTNWVKVMEGNYSNARGAGQAATSLGPGEYIEPGTGRRTYGSGQATIPAEAPPRPGPRYSWDAQTDKWVML